MTVLYHQMDRAQLDAAYNNVEAVGNFSALFTQYQQRSQTWYAQTKAQRNIPYTNSPRTCFDFFQARQPGAPTLIFIHGGYWQNCNKEDFAFIAEGPFKNGFNVILAEYTLAPAASMTGIVNEITALLDFLYNHQQAFNITLGKVCLSGHSAGGHLTALHRQHPLVSHALPLSALVDLQPISLSWLNDKLALTPQEIRDYSPLFAPCLGCPTSVYVGAEELPELIRHSESYAAVLTQAGEQVVYQRIAGRNHFSLLDEFDAQGGKLLQALQQLLVL